MNYELQVEVKASSNEITYRKENCHDISRVANEDIKCSACGEQLIAKTGRCYVNRVVGTLQCQICYDRCEVKKPWEPSNRHQFCIMCGKSSEGIQKCYTKDCAYSSCQSCILRNKSETSETNNRKWNCFVCHVKQLYPRRAIAAAVMASLSEKSCDRPIKIMPSKGNVNDKNTSIKGKKRKGINKQNMIYMSDSDSSDDKSERNIFQRKIATQKPSTSTTPTVSSGLGIKTKNLKGHLSNNCENNTQLSTNDLISSKNKRKTNNTNTEQLNERKLNEKKKKSTKHIKKNNNHNSNNDSSSNSSSNSSSCNNIHNTLKLLRRENSNSSSDKEFSRYKIIPSYVPLQRIPDIDKDYTISPSQSPSIEQPSSQMLSKQDAFIMKNNVHKFFQDMKSCVKKMENDIELIEKNYHYREKLKIDDATRIMVGCTNIIRDLKQHVRNSEDQVIKRYDTWCKKAKIKNIFINTSHMANDGVDTPNRYKKHIAKPMIINSSDSDSDKTIKNYSTDAVNSSKKAARKKKTVVAKSNCEGQTPIEISDFDESEIFSANEGSIPSSPITINNSITNENETMNSTENNKTMEKLHDENIIDSAGNNEQSNAKINNESDNGIVENSAKDLFAGCVNDQITHDINSSEKIPQRSSTPQSTVDPNINNSGDSQSSVDMFRDESENEANNDDNSSPDTSIKSRSESSIEKMNEDHVDKENDKSKGAILYNSSSSDTEIINPKILKKKSRTVNSSDEEPGNGTKSINNIESSPSNANYIDEEDNELKKAILCSSSSSDTATIITKTSNKKSRIAVSSDEEIANEMVKEPAKSPRAKAVGEGFEKKDNKSEKNNSKRKSSRTKMKSFNDRNESLLMDETCNDNDDTDNISEEQTKKALLDSSSDSDHETLINTSNEQNDSHLSDDELSDNEDLIKEKTEESKSSQVSNNSHLSLLKPKRDRFVLSKNKHYKCDSKLRMILRIELTRLGKNILEQHSNALKLSKEYLENKLVKSLVSIDSIEKKRKKSHLADSLSTSDDDETMKRPVKLNRKEKEMQDTLLDHLNKATENDEESDSNNGGDDNDTNCDSSNEMSTKNFKGNKNMAESFTSNADKLYKAALLESSHSEADENELENSEKNKMAIDADNINETSDNNDKSKKYRKTNKQSDLNDEDLLEKNIKKDKNKWKHSKALTVNFSDTDSEEENRKIEKKITLSEEISKNSDESDNKNEDSERTTDSSPMKKKRTRRRRLASDSDIKITDDSDTDITEGTKNDKRNKLDNDSDDGKKLRKRRRKSDNSSDSSTGSLEVRKSKPKRKRIRAVADDSDSESGNEQNSFQGSNKSGRKNIRKVLKNKQVADDTKQAGKLEEERLRRMAERQKLYNEMYEARLANEEKVDKLVLDFDEESKEVLLSVDENLVKRLKPHQARGIKFMWDASYESLERAKTTSGSGCILAHCMGLGKSFQVVTLSHTLLSNSEKTKVNTILIVAPLSTVLNWVNEFKIWLAEVDNGDDIEIYEMTKCKTTYERKYQLESWMRTGGVLIIGYEMFRNLTNATKKVKKNVRESILKCLVDPGADLVICDEGHLLKNEESAISKAMRRIRTLRRVVLTGTPLQNNLIEYHCMVQFVKPNLLGTKKEFSNRFVNPIQNGQFDDSTEHDVKIMKKRAHVLHKMLEGSVQRFDYSVLMPFLPPKQEYVILARLTPVQVKLYQYYLDNMARQHVRVGSTLFADFQALQRIWTHPRAVKSHTEKMIEKRREADTDSEGSLKDFIDDGSDMDSSSKSSSNNDSDVVNLDSSGDEKKKNKRGTRANPNDEPVAEVEVERKEEWWSEFVSPEDLDDIRVSAKLLLLFDIIKECEAIGDKVLVFSQSLYSLTLIEQFLGMVDDETQKGNELESLGNHSGNWLLGSDYFRFDGQTSADNRSHWVKLFNKPSNTRARLFLISTRAGGLGINLTAANRVVIFDASWNPSHDVQSIFRIYRFGQKKPCYVYRLLAAGTMEEKIYNRQVTKLSLSCRVVDEQQIERHFSNNDLAELYTFEPPSTEPSQLALPKDRLIAEIFLRHKNLVETYHEHDSLLENIAGEELDDEERKQAWLEYEQEKAGKPSGPMQTYQNYQQQQQMLMMQQYNSHMLNNLNMNELNVQGEFANLLQFIRKDYPNLPEATQRDMAIRTLSNMYSYVENQVTTNLNVPVNIGNFNNPTATLANALAQQEYARQHSTVNKYQQQQQQQQQQQIQYAQKFGNNIGNVPAARTAGTTLRDDDIVELPSSSSRTNSTLPTTSSTKSQEE